MTKKLQISRRLSLPSTSTIQHQHAAVVVEGTLDYLLEEIGDLGRYQIFVIALFSIVVIMHSMQHIAYVFTAKDLTYRCRVPQCEGNDSSAVYNATWLTLAIPNDLRNTPEKCTRWQIVSTGGGNQTCDIDTFLINTTTGCLDGYVYATDESTIVQDFALQCDAGTWRLPLIGTINNVGQFVGLPLAGIYSDRYGRRALLVWGMLLSAICGIAKAFAQSYTMFAFLEFCDAAFSAGTYACAFILAIELVGPSKRVLTSTIITLCYPVGEVLIAQLAWCLKSWRMTILAIYIPPLLIVTYLWITPESIRWLLSQNRMEEACDVLRRAARINRHQISEESLRKLQPTTTRKGHREPLWHIFTSHRLLLRFANCCLCWVTCAFLYYGLTLNSVSLASNNHNLDFTLVSLVEIPAYLVTYAAVDRFGRCRMQCLSLVSTALICTALIFVATDKYTLQLIIYLLGKFGATIAFTIIYIITSEVFPTSLRHSMMGTCSMIGRLGSAVAPQVPLLGKLWVSLPYLLFAFMGILSGVLSIFFPETLRVKLPDTIEEAEVVGRRRIAE